MSVIFTPCVLMFVFVCTDKCVCTYVCLLDCHRMIVLLAVVTRLRLYIVSIREANFLSVEMCFFHIHQLKDMFGCSKELSHCDDSFGYPQYMYWVRNKKEMQ